MRFFQPEVEVTLKTLGILMLLALVAWPMTWGYEQRQRARDWQNIACAYRLREAQLQMPMLVDLKDRGDACETIDRLGLDFVTPR
jgi:hypothetical protein